MINDKKDDAISRGYFVHLFLLLKIVWYGALVVVMKSYNEFYDDYTSSWPGIFIIIILPGTIVLKCTTLAMLAKGKGVTIVPGFYIVLT